MATTNPDLKEILFRSIQNESIKTIKGYLEQDDGIDDTDEDGNTFLHIAAQHGRKDVVELLLEKGADVHTGNSYSNTPLHTAIEYGRKDVVELLLEKGADVHAKNFYGDTPLHTAVEQGHKDLVELLLARGAEVGAVNNMGHTPAYIAASGGYKDILEFLLSKELNPVPRLPMEYTLLNAAASKGHINIVEFLLARGDNINEKSGYYRDTALHIAVKKCETKVVELLLKEGADVNMKNNDTHEELPLHCATKNDCMDMVILLLEHGANVNAKRVDGLTPLHIAFKEGLKDIAKVLIARGADVEAKTKKDKLPLDLVSPDHKEFFATLVRNTQKSIQSSLLLARFRAFAPLCTHIDDETSLPSPSGPKEWPLEIWFHIGKHLLSGEIVLSKTKSSPSNPKIDSSDIKIASNKDPAIVSSNAKIIPMGSKVVLTSYEIERCILFALTLKKSSPMFNIKNFRAFVFPKISLEELNQKNSILAVKEGSSPLHNKRRNSFSAQSSTAEENTKYRILSRSMSSSF